MSISYTAAPKGGGQKTGLYVPSDWGRYWRAKLLTGSAPRLALAGDSITRGYFSSDLGSKGWAGLLRSALQATYGDGGGGHRGAIDTSIMSGAVTSYPAEQATLSNAATPGSPWSNSGTNDGPGSTSVRTFGPGNYITLQRVRGTTIRIFCHNDVTLGAAATYSIDGGAPVAFTTLGTKAVGITTVSGLANTDHTVTITHADVGTQSLIVSSAEGSNATGVLVNNYGRASGGSNQLSLASSGYGSGGEWSGGSLNPADLVIYAYGVNDAGGGVTAAGYLANVDTYLRRVRGAGAKRGQVDILFLMQHMGNNTAAALTAYRDNVNNVRTVAETYGAAVVDMWAIGANSWDRWSDLGYWSSGTTPPLGSAGQDSLHPSDAGHQAIADVLIPIVSAAA